MIASFSFKGQVQSKLEINYEKVRKKEEDGIEWRELM